MATASQPTKMKPSTPASRSGRFERAGPPGEEHAPAARGLERARPRRPPRRRSARRCRRGTRSAPPRPSSSRARGCRRRRRSRRRSPTRGARLGERAERDEDRLRRRGCGVGAQAERLERLGVAVRRRAPAARSRRARSAGGARGSFSSRLANSDTPRIGVLALGDRVEPLAPRRLELRARGARSRARVSMPPSRSMRLEAPPRLARERVGERLEVVRAAGGVVHRARASSPRGGRGRCCARRAGRARTARPSASSNAAGVTRSAPPRTAANTCVVTRSMFTQGSRCVERARRADRVHPRRAAPRERRPRRAPSPARPERAELAQLDERVATDGDLQRDLARGLVDGRPASSSASR